MHDLIPVIQDRTVPKEWDYQESIKKVRNLILRWTTITIEILHELWIANKVFSSQGYRSDLVPNGTKFTFRDYCHKVGISKSSAYRWLERYDPQRFEIKPLPLPIGKKYDVICGDPPWRYHDRHFQGLPVEAHYPSMSTEDICKLPIKDLANNCVLFLWTTVQKLLEGLTVMDSWGFEYKTHYVWDKIDHNYGYYSSVRHELLLLGTIGSGVPRCSPKEVASVDSAISIRKSRRHSEKPVEFYELIEKLYPRTDKIELFARNKRDGWDSWGDEIDFIQNQRTEVAKV